MCKTPSTGGRCLQMADRLMVIHVIYCCPLVLTRFILLKTHSEYSMCPITLQILNFPKPVRCSNSSMLLWSILPGPRRPQSLSTYLRRLMHEFLVLKDGIEAFDANTSDFFTLKARCVLEQLDYDGQQMFPDSSARMHTRNAINADCREHTCPYSRKWFTLALEDFCP